MHRIYWVAKRRGGLSHIWGGAWRRIWILTTHSVLGAIIIGRYLPIDSLAPDLRMPIIPYSELDPSTRRLPTSSPAAAIVNAVLDGYCGAVIPVNNYVRDTLNRAVPGSGDIVGAFPGAINGLVCPNAPVPPDIPFDAPPLYAMGAGCTSFGTVAGELYVFQGGRWQLTAPFEQSWDCNANLGFPVGGIQYYQGNGTAQYLGVLCQRADGTTYVQNLTPESALAPTIRLVVTRTDFFPCPGCDPTPIRPRLPGLPERPVLPDPPVIPEIPIDIDIPRLPGIPPLSFPVIYAPIIPTLNVNAPITLAPRFNLSPEFQFAPKIELNLGGISIEGGGYPEPIPDVREIITESGGDCPDPCEPVDYDAIRTIAIEELDAKFPPTRPFSTETIVYAAQDSSSIVLPEFAQWVTITIVEPPRNVREQEGNALAPNVFYNGWYSFGVEADTGVRIPIQYNFVSVPVPVGARQFSYTIIGLGTASLTVGYYLEI